MHHKCSQCLCLPLLHFAPHASTSQLRNDAGNCVTVPVLIHHVCNECAYAECVSTCLCVWENICLRWVKSLTFCTVHVWDSVDVSVVMLFVWLRVCKGWDLLVAVNLSAFHVLFVCCLVSYGTQRVVWNRVGVLPGLQVICWSHWPVVYDRPF